MRGNFVTDRNGCNNPNYKHGLRDTRLFSIWCNMKNRCYNPNSTFFQHYGGRGITVCDEWQHDFLAFYDWAMSNGYSDDLSIDRIDVNGNYEPSNCRWATSKEQGVNRRNNKTFVVNGKEKPLVALCKEYNINYSTVQDRLKRGWQIEKALSCPVDSRFRKKEVVK